jgi:phosphatidate phosphatase APP1
VILENTFLKELEQVAGMAELYQKWAALGGHVHYVSNGPWQLFPMLAKFFANFNFPPGSAHMRIIDRSDVMTTIRGQPGAHKLETIPKIMSVSTIYFCRVLTERNCLS